MDPPPFVSPPPPFGKRRRPRAIVRRRRVREMIAFQLRIASVCVEKERKEMRDEEGRAGHVLTHLAILLAYHSFFSSCVGGRQSFVSSCFFFKYMTDA